MLKIIISGAAGRMGRAVADLAAADPELTVAAGIDVFPAERSFPLFASPSECDIPADVVVDFSAPSALAGLLAYGKRTKTPLILASTGYTRVQEESIVEASKEIPIFRSANMSVGVNLLSKLVKEAAEALGVDFDIEIVERHHNKKVDAPSGTALMLAAAAREGRPDIDDLVYDRQSVRAARTTNQLGISSVRGGTIAGDHEVIFAGTNEVIELRHHAATREVFAAGAVRAAKFMAQVKTPGMYDMQNVIAG